SSGQWDARAGGSQPAPHGCRQLAAARVQEAHKSDSEGGQFQNPQDNVASISQQDVPTILSQGMDVSPQAPMLVAMPVAEQNDIIDVSEPELVNTSAQNNTAVGTSEEESPSGTGSDSEDFSGELTATDDISEPTESGELYSPSEDQSSKEDSSELEPSESMTPTESETTGTDSSTSSYRSAETDDELTSEHVGRTSSKLAAFREKTEKLRKYDPTDRKVGTTLDCLHPWSKTHYIHDPEHLPNFWKKTARWKKRKLGATLCIGNRRIPSEGKGKKKSRADSVGKVDKVMIALDCLHKPMQDEKQVDRVLAWIDRADAAQRDYVERRKAEPPKVTKVKKPTAQDVADALNKNTEAFKTFAAALALPEGASLQKIIQDGLAAQGNSLPVNGDQPTEAQDQGAEEGAGPLDDDDNELDERDAEHEAAAGSAHEDEDAEDDAADSPQEAAAKSDPAADKPSAQPAVQTSAAHSSPQRSSTPVQSAPAQTSAPLEAPAQAASTPAVQSPAPAASAQLQNNQAAAASPPPPARATSAQPAAQVPLQQPPPRATDVEDLRSSSPARPQGPDHPGQRQPDDTATSTPPRPRAQGLDTRGLRQPSPAAAEPHHDTTPDPPPTRKKNKRDRNRPPYAPEPTPAAEGAAQALQALSGDPYELEETRPRRRNRDSQRPDTTGAEGSLPLKKKKKKAEPALEKGGTDVRQGLKELKELKELKKSKVEKKTKLAIIDPEEPTSDRKPKAGKKRKEAASSTTDTDDLAICASRSKLPPRQDNQKPAAQVPLQQPPPRATDVEDLRSSSPARPQGPDHPGQRQPDDTAASTPPRPRTQGLDTRGLRQPSPAAAEPHHDTTPDPPPTRKKNKRDRNRPPYAPEPTPAAEGAAQALQALSGDPYELEETRPRRRNRDSQRPDTTGAEGSLPLKKKKKKAEPALEKGGTDVRQGLKELKELKELKKSKVEKKTKLAIIDPEEPTSDRKPKAGKKWKEAASSTTDTDDLAICASRSKLSPRQDNQKDE
ncbi:hypothetical protein KFL_012660010, partial [Klebsormidium nitens]